MTALLPSALKGVPADSDDYRAIAAELFAAGAICSGFDCTGCVHCDASQFIPGGPVVDPVRGPLGDWAGSGNARADEPSAKQLAFVAALRAERDLVAPVGERLSRRSASDLIAALLDTPKVAAPSAASGAGIVPSGRPNRFAGKCAECGSAVAECAGWIDKPNGRWLTHHHAGECVEAVETGPAPITDDGMYQHPDTGEVYKVQRSRGSDRLYAKALELDADGSARFTYVSGLIARIDPAWRMSLDQASAFGQLYGVCCQCAAVLTDERSIAAGIGPICAGKF